LYAGDDTEDDLDSKLLNSIASTISNWRTFKFLRWAQLFNRTVDLDEILYGGDGIEYYFDYIVYCLIPHLQPFQNGRRLNF
jgi:hypothetical protein